VKQTWGPDRRSGARGKQKPFVNNKVQSRR